eukprot:GGOE01009535.1.p6 GENE.GGOE01009535.1~~GGOE01009535.1.p6  ORF type:complete len:148 (-),score=5.77 GGOE01009535.1:961-1404(-)
MCPRPAVRNPVCSPSPPWPGQSGEALCSVITFILHSCRLAPVRCSVTSVAGPTRDLPRASPIAPAAASILSCLGPPALPTAGVERPEFGSSADPVPPLRWHPLATHCLQTHTPFPTFPGSHPWLCRASDLLSVLPWQSAASFPLKDI